MVDGVLVVTIRLPAVPAAFPSHFLIEFLKGSENFRAWCFRQAAVGFHLITGVVAKCSDSGDENEVTLTLL
jgi:hypothetical protein